ncbi:MAG: hypothetical protein FWH05_08580 [Oscillospiraceae bacterium]|nr:hypothetical protein [Oscillospiraceae bacterium]
MQIVFGLRKDIITNDVFAYLKLGSKYIECIVSDVLGKIEKINWFNNGVVCFDCSVGEEYLDFAEAAEEVNQSAKFNKLFKQVEEVVIDVGTYSGRN